MRTNQAAPKIQICYDDVNNFFMWARLDVDKKKLVLPGARLSYLRTAMYRGLPACVLATFLLQCPESCLSASAEAAERDGIDVESFMTNRFTEIMQVRATYTNLPVRCVVHIPWVSYRDGCLSTPIPPGKIREPYEVGFSQGGACLYPQEAGVLFEFGYRPSKKLGGMLG